MSKTNLAQHEQYLKHLESSLKEICDTHKQMDNLVRHSWTMVMQLFIIADDLRTARREFEQPAQKS